MKRWLLVLGGVAVVGGGWIALTVGVRAVVRSGIETAGGEATATQVAVRDVRLSLFSGRGVIEGLTIENPPGFDTDPAFSVDRIVFHLEIGSLPSDVIVIRDVRIDSVRLSVEQKLLKKNNLLALLNNLRTYADTPEETTAWSTRFVIEQVTVSDVHVTLRAPLIADRILTVPDVRINDIGRPTIGVSIPEVPLRLLEPVISEVLRTLQRRALGG